ncbi:DNA topoisomerase II [Roridomyces roridus]|uniref:DNA topoisomerase 2 n=1 Tax=Roridomyces roridus TaxID=1738132 RepID=A0AAD7BTK1_9AGAR|nr:DNA topoisomerase II [Roridomyces roridus]
MLRAVFRCGIYSRRITCQVNRIRSNARLTSTNTTTHSRHFAAMSSDEGENFDFVDDGSDSEGYAPTKKTTKKAPAKAKAAPKATKIAPKAKATAATKSKAAPKKKILADRNDADDSANEGGDASDGPVAGPSTSGDVPAPARKDKTASEKYTKLSQIEHILVRPDSYIGSIEKITQQVWTHDKDTNRMVFREVTFVPGFFKIVDEILVNAADHKITDPNMDTLKVEINVEDNLISVYNNGQGIPIEIHSTEKVYIPELIFGHLLAGSSFDDNEKKLTGGRNGYGAKLANIYSHEFTVETADRKNSQKYKQTWTKNMGVCGKAKITSNAKGDEWTKITFRPDLKRFGMDSIDEDTASLLRRRVYDLAGTVKDVKVFYNDKRISAIKNFKQYMEMYLSSAADAASEAAGGAATTKASLIHERINNRWEVGFAVSDGSFQQVSFANSISTTKGGTHVNVITDQISKHILATIGKKNKGAAVKAAQIKSHMWIFVNALIENPTFDSQTKDTLTLQASKFGTKPVLSEEFLKKVMKSPIVENILNWAQFKADQQIKKTDGTKRSRLTGLPKLADANNAGTKYAKDCTLILTEGDSAKSLAIAGLSVVGRDNFGVFPLRGKLLNVREAKHDQIMKNEEIQNIKQIMGLQHGKEYTSTASLRYGRLMIMTDQDHDGSHIKGLIINYLDHFYPSLLKLDDFLVEFVTPIVRVTKGTTKKNFFTIPEFEQWLEDTPGSDRWTVKYYKGLGTSKDEDARDYFSHMEKHMIPFAATQEGDRDLIDLAFSKKKADDRKEWLRQFKPGTYLDHRLEEIPYSEFVNKELILFSMADNIRSIPSVSDGLKPGQRKVIWACFKRNMKTEIKVAQLVGYIGEKAAYHHGEVSLASTIVNLAQTYVGSNNINLLEPNGQFGTRDQGGKDAASARYIHTLPSRIARTIYHPHDDPLLTQQKDDNLIIEPEWYMPVVPLVLINGAEGIGTGWSTSIPCFNPDDIVANLRRMMNGEEMVPMQPWWRGFKGEIRPTSKNKYDVFGLVNKLSATSVEITELPVGKWTQNYKAELEAMIAGKDSEPGTIKDYKEYHDNTNVHFVINMDAKNLEKAEEKGLIEFFKLSSKFTTSNMICFDFDGKIKKYNSPEEIIEDFYPQRLAFYQKRKDHLAKELQNVFEKLTNQARFVQMIVDKELVVSNRKKADIIVDLKKHEFRPFPKISKAKEAGEEEEALEDEESQGSAGDFDYLLGMAISSLTREKIEKLRQTASEKEDELLTLLKISPKEMWNTDLDKFMAEWEALVESIEAKVAIGGKGKRKNAVLRTRKSIGKKRGSDSEDDFKPIKAAAAKRKAPESKRPKPAAVKEEDDDEEVVPPPKKRAPAKKKDAMDVDEEEEVVAVAAKKRAPPKKKVVESDVDSDDEDDEEVIPAPKKRAAPKKADKDDMDVDEVPPPKKKAPAKKSADSDSEIEVVKEAPKKTKATLTIDSDDDEPPKGKGKAKAAPKRKSLDSTVDSDDEPPKKKKQVQPSVAEFFGKAGPSKPKISKSMKPASPPKPKKAPTKKVADSSDDELNYDDIPVAPARTAARPTRAPPKKYVEIPSDDDDDEGAGVGSESMFVDE